MNVGLAPSSALFWTLWGTTMQAKASHQLWWACGHLVGATGHNCLPLMQGMGPPDRSYNVS